MAIFSGEGSETPAPARRARQARNPAEKPGLFYRTVIPSGAVTASISCSLIPAHALQRSRGESPVPLRAARELVVASGSRVTLHTLDRTTLAMRELATLHLFAAVRDIRAMSSPVPGRDVLVVLMERNRVAFVQFDERACRLRVAGQVCVLNFAGAVSESRLVATHPRKWICAVASLASTVVVFPVLFLRKDVSAGKIVRVDIDGVILGLDFLEDEDGLPSDAILLVLVQRGGEQWIAVYTVGAQPGTSGGSGGLSVTHVGSMITCSERPDETAVARHAAKLGTELRAPAQALGLARIPRSPFLFAVFLEGRVVAADARPVIVGALEARDSLPLAVRVRPERHPVHFPSRWHTHATGGTLGGGDAGAEGAPRENFFVDDNGEHNPGARTLVPLGMISGAARASRSVAQRRGLASALGDGGRADPYLSFLYVPSCVSLDLGTGEGAPTAWTSARDHFCCDSADDYDEDGMYIVMESGALFALRWSTVPRKGAYVIPAEERTRTGPRRNFLVEYAGHVGPGVSISALDKNLLYIANDGADGSLRRVEPPRLANTPGTDPRWAAVARMDPESVLASSVISNVGYVLEVRQEFLNLSPISDFIIIPPGGVEPVVNSRITRSFGHMRAGDSASPTSASPVSQPRQGSKRVRGTATRKADQIQEYAERGPFRREAGSSSVGSSSRRAPSRRSGLENSPSSTEYPDGSLRSDEDKDRQVEPQVVLCCGLQKAGTIRIVKPGAPVTLFSSSESVFQGCNDMWSIRLSSRARHDAMIVLSFTQSTRVLFSVPPSALNRSAGEGTISHLLDATNVTNIIAETRSIVVGRLEDGLIAQVHSCGVRTIQFLKKSEMRVPLQSQHGEVRSPLVKHFWDWTVPDGHVISVAAIGAKMVFVCVVRTQCRSPCLIILKQHSVDECTGGLTVVSTLELDDELSCISVPEWTALDFEDECEDDEPSPRFPPMIVLGTYAPSVEVWLLGPDPEMECVAVTRIAPWFPASAARMLADQVKDDEEEDAHVTSAPATHPMSIDVNSGRSDTNSKNADRNTAIGQLWTRKSSTSQQDDGATEQNMLKTSIMTGVPESICAFESNGKQWIFTGLRNGTILRFCFGDATDDQSGSYSPRRERRLHLVARNRIGDVPVKLCRVVVSSGLALIAQAERPWICLTEGGDVQWIPLSFPQTRAWCPYSTPGADRCMATVTMDDVMHICALRRLTPVSVRSILVGDTPRRVVALNSPVDALLVATCREPTPRMDGDSFDLNGAMRREEKSTDQHASVPFSELKVFHMYTKKLMGRSRLKPDELVHVLIKWAEFIVVGTSCGIRSARNSGGVGGCQKGRLLLYSVSSQMGSKPGVQISRQGRGKRDERALIELCSEVIMPGAVLAGAVHPDQGMLVVSANDIVFVFGKLKNAFFEVARVSTRLMVVSISLHGPTVCVADQKDSVGFFRLNWASGDLVRDRTDHRNRIVADAVMVDSRTAMVTDKFGGLFSLAYKDGDRESTDGDNYAVRGSVLSLMPDSVLNELCQVASTDNSLSGGLPPVARSWTEGVSHSAFMDDDISEEEGTDSQAYLSDTLGESNDGTAQEDAVASENAGNSAMNDVLYEGSGVDTVGTDGGEDEDMENDESMDEDEIANDDLNEVQMEEDEDDEEVVQFGGGEQPLPGADIGLPGGLMPAAIEVPLAGLQNFLPVRPRRGDKMPVLRNLVCHHDFNMRDAALRVRYGTFKRFETISAPRFEFGPLRTRRRGSFWTEKETAVFAGTLGGALVSAVPIDAATVTVLSEIGSVLSSHADVCGSGLEPNHRRFRAGYGGRSEGVVDGDLLQLFLTLSVEEKREVTNMAGFVAEDSVFQVEALIEELCGRVG